MTPLDLTGRSALVTGGNRGIGRAIVRELARAGAAVTFTARSEANVALALADLPDGVEGQVCDVTDHEGMAALLAPGVDILVNNAGIIRRADAVDFTEADWDAVMDTNLKTVFFLCQAAGRRMLASGRGGKIINIASMLSFQGGIRVPSYTASKSGLAGLTRLLANEWAGRGVNVNAIAPGYFETNNTDALRRDETRSREILGRIPAGRWGRPEDLGGAAVFLASEAAAYVHGVVLPVDGGWLAR